MATKKTMKSKARASAPRTKTPAGTMPPRVGEVWKGQGGRYLGVIRAASPEQPDDYLVAAEVKIKGAWGPAVRVAGADSDYDGAANTVAMIAAGSELAKKIAALKIDGHSDFFLGAREQARLARVNCPKLFGDEWVWTSTQYASVGDWAWQQFFGRGGDQYGGPKSYEDRAFVVRRIPIR